ncbi:MAG TPA: PPOX class F420-dependent oxidoreductase [Anaerolineales bacterium]|nr:PPOX class F420-dependent oxidoreductase [Anaerolineales bacterium]
MQAMTQAEIKQFLTKKPRTAVLATTRADGSPHAAPIWFELDGDELVFTTWYSTVKAANLVRDPRLALVVDDETPPYAFVLIEGTAALDPAADDLLYWTTRIAGRYLGEELAPSYGARNAVPGEWLVRVTPTRIVAQKGIAD